MLVWELNASAKLGVLTSVMEPRPTIHDQLKLYMQPHITKIHVLAGFHLYHTLYYTLNNNQCIVSRVCRVFRRAREKVLVWVSLNTAITFRVHG